MVACVVPFAVCVGRLLPHHVCADAIAADLNNFYTQYASIEPWLQTKTEKANSMTEHPQTIEDRKLLDGMYEVRCAPCACATPVC